MLAFLRQHAINPFNRSQVLDLDDPATFDRCVTDCRSSVQHLCLHMLRDHAEADRVTAATFAAALHHRADAGVREDFRLWVLGHAGRLCLDLLADGLTLAPRGAAGAISRPADQGVEAGVAHRARLLLDHLDRLAPQDRLIVLLRCWEHLPFEQIAAVLPEAVEVTQRRYHIARERLAERMADDRRARPQPSTRA